MLIRTAASEYLQFLQFDVKFALLYGKLQEEIFMKQPEGYGDESSRVCKFKKSLYGLKLAPRCWSKSGEFQVTVGSPDCFLGMTMKQMKNCSIFVEQLAYAKRILHRFHTDESNAVAFHAKNITRVKMTLMLVRMCPSTRYYLLNNHSVRNIGLQSKTGVVSKFANCAISWASQKQKSVVLSITEVEYVATCEGAKECIWLNRFFSEIASKNACVVS
ncbi:hypothetical protein AVEN_12989-1 [Araneus ventricosus]|uniref:Reverse transcriptase Ty1/copia-type domain-containing protein n=1 Tax=Araneus ventricosus TaxID=182803 RepID=A0A4Y2QKC1_ARAVE|nr:hypothetical protein AVEN_12989-1 [Araneus ventricosus]